MECWPAMIAGRRNHSSSRVTVLLANEEAADSIAAETKWRRCEHFSATQDTHSEIAGGGGNNAE